MIERDPAARAEMLSAWSSSRTLLLDMRDADAFHARRLAGAVNLPRTTMSGRLHELPPRSRPLAVVLDPAPVACVDEDAWYRAQLAWFTADFKGNPWTLRGCVVGDDALFDDAAARSGFPVATGAANPTARLWEPSDNVARWLPAVEARMAHRWGRGGRLLEGAASSKAASSEAASSEEEPASEPDDHNDDATRPLCVDLGCGAGRDAVYAALRGWRVLALDSDAKGLARCAALAEAHGVRDRVAPVRVDLERTDPAVVFETIGARPWSSLVNDARASAVDWASLVSHDANDAFTGAPAHTLASTAKNPVRAVLAVRFLQRRVAQSLPWLLPAGAAVMWFHFMRGAELTAVGRPNKAKDLLEDGELRTAFGAERGWTVVADGATKLPDGRPVSEFVAVRDRVCSPY